MNDQQIEVERENVMQVLVPSKVSQLENDLDYQTKTEVETAVEAEATLREAADEGLQSQIDTKQGTLESGDNITIDGNNKISAYAAPLYSTTGDNTDGAMTQKATTSALSTEATARQNADIGLQGQIDAISASSDVADIVGTKADLNSYDTSKLTDKAIIKVLADESQGGATTYYRWSKTSETFTLIGTEGPYYTKSQTDTNFQKKLVAGSNVTIGPDGKTISATDTTYQNFTGTDGTLDGATGLVPAPTRSIVGPESTFLSADGSWRAVQGQRIVAHITPRDDVDTPSGWILGSEDVGFVGTTGVELFSWYNAAGYFASQPSATGLLRMVKRTEAGGEVEQTWTTFPTGERYSRVGRLTTWNKPWTRINEGITTMTGATTSTAGTQGTVTAPSAGSPERSLKADGSWGLTRVALGLENLDVSDDTPGGWHTAILNALSIPDTTSVYEVNIRYYSDSHFASQPATLGNLQVFLIGHTPVLQVWTTLYTGETYQRVGGPNGWDAPAWSRIIREKDAGVVSTSMLADSAITSEKINSEAVTRAKFGSGAEMVGAASSANGERGVAPAPSAGEEGEFLRGDGTWASPPLATNASAGTIQSPANKIVSITATDFNALTTKDPNTLYLVTGA